MPAVLFATLGQRPQAVTVAVDRLRERVSFEAVVILHTDPHDKDGVKTALRQLRQALATTFPDLPVHWVEITHEDGTPLRDITDQYSANAYLRGVFDALLAWPRPQWERHLLVAGGRKSMSIYATLAAALLFGTRDRVWSVHSSQALIQWMADHHAFAIPSGRLDEVQLIRLPILTIRSPGPASQLDPQALLEQRRDVSMDFLSRLTEGERRVAETVAQHPDATYDEIGAYLSVTDRTVETHMRSVFGKMIAFFDFPESIKQKRLHLLDILHNRI